jgi:hypothetical protein
MSTGVHRSPRINFGVLMVESEQSWKCLANFSFANAFLWLICRVKILQRMKMAEPDWMRRKVIRWMEDNRGLILTGLKFFRG